MKKFVFLIFLLLLTGANTAIVSFAISSDFEAVEMPIPADGEEAPGEESKNLAEEDDDEVGVSHRWISKEKSSNANLHFHYQEIVFHDLELKVVIPPPKA